MSEIEKNRFVNSINKYLLLTSVFVLAAVIGSLWLGWGLTILMLAIIGGFMIFTPELSPQVMLKWQKAQQISPYQYPDLYNRVAHLARRAKLPKMPALYLIPKRQLNAFAIGSKEKPIIGVTAGLLSYLSERQLYGVLAHEISHIKNNDLSIKRIAYMFGNFTKTLSFVGRVLLILNLPLILLGYSPISLLAILALIFSPALNLLLQLGLSRTMEFLADHDAAALTDDPIGLASALKRISDAHKPWWRWWQQPQVQSADWLSSHPNTEARIDKLVEIDQHNRRNRYNPFSRSEVAFGY
ncbi:MAG: zinc metalloprotease HtpX [Bacteroidota bacterium]